MELADGALPWQSVYKLMTGAIVPRPIGWVSSVSAAGMDNLAPFSFFNAVCSNPPHLLFCPAIRATTGSPKDTLNNVRATGEFIVNIVSEHLAEAMNVSSGEYGADVDEFEVAGLTKTRGVAVNVARVAESLVHFECRLHDIITLGDAAGAGSIVIGRIVHIHVDDRVLIAPDKISIEALKPIGRLAGNSYSTTHDLFELIRPKI